MSSEENYSCVSCELNFHKDVSQFIDHISSSHFKDKLQCTWCPLQFHGANSFIDHVLKNHIFGDGLENSVKLEGKEFECPICPYASDSGEEVNRHYLIIHDQLSANKPEQNDKCPVCFEKQDQQYMEEHVQTHFNDSKLKTSDNATFEDDAEIAKHLQKEEEGHVSLNNAPANHVQINASAQQVDAYLGQGVSAINQLHMNGRIDMGQAIDQTIMLHNEITTGFENPLHPVHDILGPMKELYSNVANCKYYFCSDVSYFGFSQADFGFGCGYRNIQMLLSCLKTSPTFRTCLWKDHPTNIPSIPKLQSLIENAWEQGFDQAGKQQFEGKLCGSKKWIGPTELAAFLASFKIKFELVDFHEPTGSNSTHPEMLNWVWDYFSRQQMVEGCIPPLYIQHQGHSRTIIGVEQFLTSKKNVIRLIILDPGMKRSRIINLLKANRISEVKCLRKGLADFKKDQYQILSVNGIANDFFIHQMKQLIRSTRIP